MLLDFRGLGPPGIKKTFELNLEIVTTFDSLDGFSILDPKNEALGLISRFLTFKYGIKVGNKIIFVNH